MSDSETVLAELALLLVCTVRRFRVASGTCGRLTGKCLDRKKGHASS